MIAGNYLQSGGVVRYRYWVLGEKLHLYLGCTFHDLVIRDATIPPKPITATAPHRRIANTGNYRLTTAHCRHITGIYMAFFIWDVYRYRRFIDLAGLFTTDYRR